MTYKVDPWENKIRDHDLITSPHTNYRWIIVTIEKYEGWTGSNRDLKSQVEGKKFDNFLSSFIGNSIIG